MIIKPRLNAGLFCPKNVSQNIQANLGVLKKTLLSYSTGMCSAKVEL